MSDLGDAPGWTRLAQLAAEQYGVIRRDQVRSYLTKAQFEHRARRGFLVRAVRGVWRIGGAPETWRQRALTACLAVGQPVAVCGLSAAHLWKLEGLEPPKPGAPIHVVVPPGRSGSDRPGILVRRAALPDSDVIEHLRIPVTTPARTLVDLAGVIGPDLLSRVTDDALRQGILKRADLDRLRVVRSPTIRRIAAHRLETRAGESAWEDRVYDWIVAAGLPAPARQYRVDLETRVAILDMAYPVEQVGIEFDGFEYHKGRGRFDRDRERTSELSAAGWRMIVVTSAHDKQRVIGRVRRALTKASVAPPEERHVKPD